MHCIKEPHVGIKFFCVATLKNLKKYIKEYEMTTRLNKPNFGLQISRHLPFFSFFLVEKIFNITVQKQEMT